MAASSKELSIEKQLSVQPFWQVQKTNKTILTSRELDKPVAVVYELQAGKDVKSMHSLPGIGLLGIMFSLDKEAPKAVLCGLLNRTKDVPLYGMEHYLLCHFYPGQFTRIFGIPSSSVTDIEAPLDDFIRIGSVPEQISCAEDFHSQVSVIQDFVSKWEQRTKDTPSNNLATYLMQDALAKHGTLRINEMAQETGYSPRYLQRVFLEHVGLTPKNSLNNIRFQSAMQMILEHPYQPLAEIAQLCGYYDQSHFTKVFKEYTGETPAAFVKKLQDILRHGEEIQK